MEESLIYSNVAVELIEIFKYLDKELANKIPDKVKENLNNVKNKEYKFKIDKTKTLNEQNILPATKQMLSIIYLKYCCSLEEASKILDKNKEREIIKEQEKCEKYNLNNIFKEKEESKKEEVQLLKIEDIPWYRKLIQRLNGFFSNILGKRN